MFRLAVTFALALMLVGPAPSEAQEKTIPQAIEDAIDGAIRPGFEAFAQQAGAMAQTVSGLCAEPTEAALDGARSQFDTLVEAWGRVEFIRLGPLSQDNRLERILFWPDRRGRGLQQIQQVIATSDETALSADTLGEKSVAVQGLAALEFALFGTDSETIVSGADAQRCAYAQAIAENIAGLAAEVSAAWQDEDGIAGLWLSPSADNPLFRDETEQINGLIKLIGDAFEVMQVQRLEAVLRDDLASMRPRSALFWRSDNWVPSLAANVAGLDALVEAADLKATVDAEAGRYVDALDFEFGNATRALSQTDMPAEAIAEDEDAYGRMVYARLVVAGLTQLSRTRLTEMYGLSSGFSRLDGD